MKKRTKRKTAAQRIRDLERRVNELEIQLKLFGGPNQKYIFPGYLAPPNRYDYYHINRGPTC